MSSSDNPEGSDRVVEDIIHQEPRTARKRPGGLSSQTTAQCLVMCDLLGNGDPEVALVEPNHKIMELIDSDDDITAVEAASYSLGLCTDADTHLVRLEEFGVKHFLDQRQARHYSDRGLHQLIRLTSTYWTTQTVSEIVPIFIGLDETQVGLTVQSCRQRHIRMHPPQLSLWQGNEPQATPLAPVWMTTPQPEAFWRGQEPTVPTTVQLQDETTIRLVRRGETWPKFTVVLTGNIHADMVKSQTLGAACAVTVVDEG